MRLSQAEALTQLQTDPNTVLFVSDFDTGIHAHAISIAEIKEGAETGTRLDEKAVPLITSGILRCLGRMSGQLVYRKV